MKTIQRKRVKRRRNCEDRLRGRERGGRSEQVRDLRSQIRELNAMMGKESGCFGERARVEEHHGKGLNIRV